MMIKQIFEIFIYLSQNQSDRKCCGDREKEKETDTER